VNTSGKWISKRAALIAATLCVAAAGAWAGEWSEAKPVLYRGDIVATYRARIVGEWLVVEATHQPQWHTYAMDNVERVKKATGERAPTTEQPTTIIVGGGYEAVGAWKKSEPKDLTQKDINWYTWGFEEHARFAVKVKKTGDAPATITVNGQLCNASLCSMVRDLKIEVPASGDGAEEAAALLEGLVDVVLETE
jgi:hypothetical protein